MTNKKRKFTFGILLDSFFNEYDDYIWKSLRELAEIHNISLICFSLGSETAKAFSFNKIVRIIKRDRFDGVITLPHFLSHLINTGKIKTLQDALGDLPLISIGVEFPGIKSVMIDNDPGFRDLIIHLLKDHNYKHPAFIKGPPTNKEAVTRFNIYKKVLDQLNIPLNNELVIQGDFLRAADDEAARILLEERDHPIDVVISSNDYMAINAIRTFKKKGLKIPGDIAVGGFDDVEESNILNPALTTVQQPLYGICLKTLELLIKMVEKQEIPDSTYIPAKLIIRESCGCEGRVSENASSLSSSIIKAARTGTKGPAPAGADQARSTPSRGITADFETLYECLILAADRQEESIFKKALTARTGLIIESKEELMRWKTLVFRLFLKGLTELGRDKSVFLTLLFDVVFKHLKNIDKDKYNFYTYQYRQYIYKMHTLNEKLLSSSSYEEFKDIFYSRVNELDIPGCYIIRSPGLGPEGSLLAGFKEEIIFNTSKTFATEELLPPDVWAEIKKPYYLIAIPLCYENYDYGYMVIHSGTFEGRLCETLGLQLISTLRSIYLFNKVKANVNNLEYRVIERTVQLKKTRNELVEAAHQAGMAEILTGLLHNIGNTLNSLNIGSSRILSLLKASSIERIRKAGELLASHKDDLTGFITQDPKGPVLLNYFMKASQTLSEEFNEINKESDKIRTKVNLIKTSIEIQQHYAYGELPEEDINLVELLEDALFISREEFFKTPVEIEIRNNGIENLKVNGQRSKIIHILFNIFKNAYESVVTADPSTKKITVALKKEGGTRIISISDNGIGISEETLLKIFNYGFTNKKNGHGFGLHISARFMRDMKGELRATSEGPGKGSTFSLLFYDNSHESK